MRIFFIVIFYFTPSLHAYSKSFDSPYPEDILISDSALSALTSEAEVPLKLAYASAYWLRARQLQLRADDDLTANFFSQAERLLGEIPDDSDRMDEIKSILRWEGNHPGEVLGWFDVNKHGNWMLIPGFMDPIDALNATYNYDDRRVCRLVAAITLDRAAQLLLDFDSDPTNSSYWSLSLTYAAFRDAINACPDPGSTSDPLLLELAIMGRQLLHAYEAHAERFLPTRNTRKLYPDLSEMTAPSAYVTKAPELISAGEFSKRSSALSKRTVEFWNHGEDNAFQKLWFRLRKQIEYWPD